MSTERISLSTEESFFLYHLICTYTTGDYRPPLESTKEHARDVANRIRTGCETLEMNREENLAVAKSFVAEEDTPVSFAKSRELFETICEHTPENGGRPMYYGPDWADTRREVLERDNRECKRCGETQSEHRERVGCDLHIHHIEPIRNFDDREEANRNDNLVALCAECHQIVEAKDSTPEAFAEADL